MSWVGSGVSCKSSGCSRAQCAVHHSLRTYEPSRDASLIRATHFQFFVACLIFNFLGHSKQTNRQVQTDSSKQTAPNKQLQTDSSKQTAHRQVQKDSSKQTPPNKHLQTDSSSLRGMRDPQKSLGSSEAEKLSNPSCFFFVLNTFGSPARCQFFGPLATLQLIDKPKQPCRRCLFNIPRACAEK